MDAKTNGVGLVQGVQGGSYHRLPQIPTMNRNVKIAQSKASLKVETVEMEGEPEAAVIHIEGTDKVIKISSDGTAAEAPDYETSDSAAPGDDENQVKKIGSSKGTPKDKEKKRQISPAPALPNKPKRGRPPKYKKEPKSDLETKCLSSAKQLMGSVEKMPPKRSSEKLEKMPALSESASPADGVSSDQDDDLLLKGSHDDGTLSLTPVSQTDTPKPETSKDSGEEVEADSRNRKVSSVTKNIFHPIQQLTSSTVYVSAVGTILPRTVLLRESERPSDSQLARVKEGDTHEFDDTHPAKWHIGELLWGRVTGHPWWPGMVSSDPFSGLYTTVKRIPSLCRMYHVQYFGDEAERGWIGERNILPFEGKQKLLDIGFQQAKLAKGKANKKQVQQCFSPNPRRRNAWEIAVAEADDALTLDKLTRIDKYTFVYEFLPYKRPYERIKTPKSGTSPSSSPNGMLEKRGRKRKQHEIKYMDEEAEDKKEESPSKRHQKEESPTKRQPREESPTKRQQKEESSGGGGGHRHGHHSQEEGSFEAYCIKHREAVLEEHPEYSNSMVIQALSQQWMLMTPQQRLRYKSKFAEAVAAELMDDDKDDFLPEFNKRSPRVSKPSLKKIEADEDNKAFTELVTKRPKKEQTPQRSVRNKRQGLTSESGSIDEEMQSEGEGTSLSSKSKNSVDSDSSLDGLQDNAPVRSRVSKTEEDYQLEIFKLSTAGPAKKEHICTICEQIAGELVECVGLCHSYFHPKCLNLDALPVGEFKCQDCTSGVHKCFCCKKADKDTKRCNVPQCGKFYHEECVKTLPQARMEGKTFICPRHVCATCFADSVRNPKAVKGRLYRCVRCPTSYHIGDFCVAAGSVHLGGFHIICSSHFTPLKSQAHHTRINVSWCFSCSKGGSLVCCETCPAAFHAECANLVSMPEDAWYCSDCASGKRPLYGDIIWIKIGNYRWWPGEVCHPRNVPHNIQEKPHQVGEFPVRFFGSHDFYWIHQGRVFLFQEGDRGSKDISACRGLFKIYCKGVKEATEAFKLWKAAKESKEQIEQEKNDRKPAPYKFVKVNMPFGNVQVLKADLAEIPRCECKPDQENPCSSDTECLNRMLMYECHPQVCPAKEMCQNQRFTKRQYPEVIPYRTESRGWGLKTLVDIKKGQFVHEYVGDLVDEEECKRRITQAHEENITNFYMLTVDKNRIIDAGPRGNYSRFMNHSCEPNLETQKWTVNGDIRVGLFALKEIPAGSELTFNYNLECLGNEKTKCACGAANCSGFLGVRPKTAAAFIVEKKKKEKDAKKKKKKKKLEVKKEHEDECFRCGEGGELVMCDKPNCPKVYHLQCLNLAKPPHGKWLCPWHHCDICGKLANKLCSECPNSFCQQHAEGIITLIKDNLICAEHTDLIAGLVSSETTSSSSALSSSSSCSGDSDDTADAKIQGSDDAEVSVKSESLESAEVNIKESKGSVKVKDESDGKKDTYGEDNKVDDAASAKISFPSSSMHTEEDRKDLVKAMATLTKVPSPAEVQTPCRTKARYKAQLRSVGNTCSPSVSVTSSPKLDDSDADSTDLVIDLPTN